MGSAWGEDEKNPFLAPNIKGELLTFTRSLVAQLFAHEGQFWDAIRDLRAEWLLDAERRLPPSTPNLLYPEDLYRPAAKWGEREETDEYERPEEVFEQWDPLRDKTDYELDERQRWEVGLRDVVESIVPLKFQQGVVDRGWVFFVAACALCDPPETELLAFADRCVPVSLDLVLDNEDKEELISFLTPMGSSRVRRFRDPAAIEEGEAIFWRRFVREVEERYLKPQGINAEDLIFEFMREKPELMMEKLKYLSGFKWQHYILVDDLATEEEVVRAFRTIVKARGTSSTMGAPHRDPLVAIQCAILHDRHNDIDPNDRRRRKYTYETLTRTFGLKGKNAAKLHVREGRKVLRHMSEHGLLP